MSTAGDFYKHLQETFSTLIDKAMPYRATVDSTPNGRVKIIPLAADTALGEEYARLTGIKLNPGDEVAVLTMSGKPFVLGKVQRGTPTGVTFDQPVLIQATDDNALRINKADGTGIVSVDDKDTSTLSVLNGIFITGFRDNGVTSTFNLDSLVGNARFNGAVTVGSLNTPIVTTDHHGSADTSSTTSTTVFASAIERTLTLPTGTWTINAFGGTQLKHSAGGAIAIKIACNTTDGPIVSPTFFADSYAHGVASGTFSGLTGSANVRYGYRSSDAGTSTAKNPWLVIIATRTS